MSKTKDQAKDQAIKDLNRSPENGSGTKVMLRIDFRTCILVSPDKATPEYAEEVRKKFEGYNNPGKRGGIQRK